VDDWKKRVDWATQVQNYADYALFAALPTVPPEKQVQLIEALQAQNPKSQYLPQAVPVLFSAYLQMKANDKAVALAEKTLATDQSNEDMLLLLSNSYFDSKKEPAKVHAYTAKVVEIMNTKQKPQGMSDADWENRKNRFLGAAHYISGKLYYTQNSFANADRELRAALPLIANDPQAKPEVLFYLGVANFKMEKVQEAANFNKECAAIKSQFAGPCTKNLAAIRSQYRGVK
jgi:tetratricopeptide (TPR) repeat protein